MSGFLEYGDYDAWGLAELVRKKQVTPIELLEAAIARVEARNPNLNAVIHKMYDRGRKAAAGKLPKGPFSGVPFLLKDLIANLAGEPISSGCRYYHGWVPETNSELVNRYLATGVVVFGKTNTPELGIVPTTEPELFGPTINPWASGITAGGSSGGSASAIAAGMVPMAGGGDGGGSIRIPCSCCGLFGMKPTRGRTPVGPDYAEIWNGFAIEHVLTRSVRDSAAMLDSVCGPFTGDTHYLPKPRAKFLSAVGKQPGKLRIAYSSEPLLPAEVHPDCVAAVKDAADLLSDLGHELIPAAPAINSLDLARAFVVIVGSCTSAYIRNSENDIGRKPTRHDFESGTWLAKIVGDNLSGSDYVAAMLTAQKETRKAHEFLDEYDVFLTPTLGQPPQPLGFLKNRGIEGLMESLLTRFPIPPVLKMQVLQDKAAEATFSFIPFTPVFNVSGQPSMSVPLYWNRNNLPIGTMFTAAFDNEALLFKLAGQLEKARPWKDRKPPEYS